jgi:hypothetical protein
MSRTRAGRDGRKSGVYLAAALVWILAGPAWAAQFHLPKIPKLGKSQPQPTEQKKGSTAPAPALDSISPNSASPGAEGDLTLTGKNFDSGTGLRMNCPEAAPSITNFKVESPTRAVAHVRFPFNTKEGPCELYLAQGSAGGNTTGEMAASGAGTPSVTQVKSDITFTISIPSAMPMALPVVYIGEGEMQFMDVMMKVQQAMQGSWQDAGKPLLLVTKGEVKLNQGDKTVFTLPASNVKEVGQMSMMGQTVGVFRLVCNDGKIYNFMEQESSDLPKGKTVEILKASLGK